MDMDIKITVDNIDEVIAAKDEAVKGALEDIGLQAEGYAKLKAPVDTGRLRNSITHSVAQDEEAVYVGTNVKYAPYVEFGTRRTKAQPYLKPAVQDHAEKYKKIVERFLKGQ